MIETKIHHHHSLHLRHRLRHHHRYGHCHLHSHQQQLPHTVTTTATTATATTEQGGNPSKRSVQTLSSSLLFFFISFRIRITNCFVLLKWLYEFQLKFNMIFQYFLIFSFINNVNNNLAFTENSREMNYRNFSWNVQFKSFIKINSKPQRRTKAELLILGNS